MKKISVIIPVYNAEECISSCLDTVLEQTLKEIEIICVDDGSNDQSADIIGKHMAKDNRIRMFSQVNKGAGKARNLGLDHAEGEYVAFMDADDCYPENDILETLYQAAVQHNVQIAGGNRLKIETVDGERTEIYVCPFSETELVRYEDFQYEYDYQNYIYMRSFLNENNIRFPSFRRFQDPPFFVRAMSTAGEFLAIPKIVYKYYYSPKHFWLDGAKSYDVLCGIEDCLKQAHEKGYEKLYESLLFRIENEYSRDLIRNCDSQIMRLLVTVENDAKAHYGNQEYKLSIIDKIFLRQKENVADLKNKVNRLENSNSYKLGRTLSYPYRKMKSLLKKYFLDYNII